MPDNPDHFDLLHAPTRPDFPARPADSRDPDDLTHRFDSLARRLGDPLARLFLLANHPTDHDLQLKAASELLPYRHAKKRAPSDDALLRLSVQPVAISINIGAPPPGATVVLAPSPPQPVLADTAADASTPNATPAVGPDPLA